MYITKGVSVTTTSTTVTGIAIMVCTALCVKLLGRIRANHPITAYNSRIPTPVMIATLKATLIRVSALAIPGNCFRMSLLLLLMFMFYVDIVKIAIEIVICNVEVFILKFFNNYV